MTPSDGPTISMSVRAAGHHVPLLFEGFRRSRVGGEITQSQGCGSARLQHHLIPQSIVFFRIPLYVQSPGALYSLAWLSTHGQEILDITTIETKCSKTVTCH